MIIAFSLSLYGGKKLKMKKYLINLQRTEYGFIEIDAKDKEQAMERALKEEMDGNANWVNCGPVEVTEVKEEAVNKVDKMPRRLPMVTLDDGKTYFIDERLKQLRNVRNPHDYIDF